MSLLVFTDLDGTLMEHESYSVEPARGALEALAHRGILPVINSSKTYAEIIGIQQRLNLDAPFICENGAALYHYLDATGHPVDKVFGFDRQSWLGEVHRLRDHMAFRFEGFSDWEPQQLAEITGLGHDEAGLAQQRQFSEPILWRDTAKAFRQFSASLAEMDLQLIEGGRFFSIQGKHDKATPMHWLKSAANTPGTTTVALGDSPNDSAMLEAADIAVIIKSAKSEQIHLQKPGRIIRTKRPGPAGWQDAILEILDSHNEQAQ